MSEFDISLLDNLSKELNIELSEKQLTQFHMYYELLIEWNEKINLTSITDWEGVVIKHFIDSMSFVKLFSSYEECLEITSGKSLADIGTGAGFPGLALKILLPELNVTLMDSLDKRIKFLNEVISSLNLEKIETIHGRAEDLAHNPLYREQFDYATARAVAALPVLCEYCIPFVKKDGFFIAYKSEKSEEEIADSKNAIFLLSGKLIDNISFVLPKTDMNRTIISIKKTNNTSKKYPRKAGTPSKKPL